jgi:O-methyltransferase
VHPDDYAKLIEDTENALLTGARTVAILGLTRVTLQLLESLKSSRLLQRVGAIYTPDSSHGGSLVGSIPVLALERLGETPYDLIVVASDAAKEDLLRSALPWIQGLPTLVIAGYSHFAFHDPVFDEELHQLLVPSLANGYPHSLTHIFQCLKNAARLSLRGLVAEFGMFKGGTTMFMSRIIERLGMDWPVVGFDTFGGFPPRKHPLDMYDHPDCTFRDLAAVQRYLHGRNVEIVPGDIVATCSRLHQEDLVFSFVDTDNYTPATAALEVIRERTVVGGAIVLDHFAQNDRFRYTMGERMAGSVLLDDSRFFHLYGTGVFYRQQ